MNALTTELTLWIHDPVQPQLARTLFNHPLLDTPRESARGTGGGAYKTNYSFQWSTAVKAMTALLLTSASTQGNRVCRSAVVLSGKASSPAASLDYALSKQPNWILDMFGVDKTGTTLARRVFSRSNPERKRPGPVSISINENILSIGNIVVLLENKRIVDAHHLRDLANKIIHIEEAPRTASVHLVEFHSSWKDQHSTKNVNYNQEPFYESQRIQSQDEDKSAEQLWPLALLIVYAFRHKHVSLNKAELEKITASFSLTQDWPDSFDCFSTPSLPCVSYSAEKIEILRSSAVITFVTKTIAKRLLAQDPRVISIIQFGAFWMPLIVKQLVKVSDPETYSSVIRWIARLSTNTYMGEARFRNTEDLLLTLFRHNKQLSESMQFINFEQTSEIYSWAKRSPDFLHKGVIVLGWASGYPEIGEIVVSHFTTPKREWSPGWWALCLNCLKDQSPRNIQAALKHLDQQNMLKSKVKNYLEFIACDNNRIIQSQKRTERITTALTSLSPSYLSPMKLAGEIDETPWAEKAGFEEYLAPTSYE